VACVLVGLSSMALRSQAAQRVVLTRTCRCCQVCAGGVLLHPTHPGLPALLVSRTSWVVGLHSRAAAAAAEQYLRGGAVPGMQISDPQVDQGTDRWGPGCLGGAPMLAPAWGPGSRHISFAFVTSMPVSKRPLHMIYLDTISACWLTRSLSPKHFP
jgi:hypothetical protein